MTPTELRQRLHQQIDQLPADLLLLAADFLDFLKFRRARSTDPSEVMAQPSNTTAESDEPVLTGATGANLLQFSGTWQGDDFEECLQYVRTFRL